MSIIGIIVVLIVIGVLLYVVTSIIPMDATIRKIITIVVILAVCLWLLDEFGLFELGTLGHGRRFR